ICETFAPGGRRAGEQPEPRLPWHGRAPPTAPRPRRFLRGSYLVLSDIGWSASSVPSDLLAARSVLTPKRSGGGRTRMAGARRKIGEGPSVKSSPRIAPGSSETCPKHVASLD